MKYKKSTLALAISAVVQASTQSAYAASTEDDATALEEIVVYGEYQQSLVNRIPITPRELPFSLNVLDRDFLDARNFTRPIEALTTLPNVIRTEDRLGTGTAGFLSRGFEAPILVDNRVQNNFRGSGARDDSFVERYEVLKGPASISFGPIGAGGVINTVTKTPGVDPFATLELRTDQFGTLAGEFDGNLGDKFDSGTLLRVSGAFRDYRYDAEETERETLAIRPVLTFSIGEKTSVKASVSYTVHSVNPNFGFPLLSTGDIPSQIDSDTFTSFENGEGKAEDVLQNVEVKHDFLDNLKLTVRGSKHDTEFDYKNTFGLYNYNYADGGPGIGLNDPYVYSYTGGGETDSEADFVDVQLAYQAEFWGQPQDFVVGLAWDDRSFDRLFSAFPGVGPFRLDDLDTPRTAPESIGPVSPFTITERELNSVFVEAAIRPTEWLTILGGIRRDDLDQETTNFRRGNAIVSSFDDDETTYRLGASAAVNDDMNVYISVAQAFAPQFGVQRNSGAVGPETSDGYEIGLKGTAFDGRLTFETAAFHTVREDVAVRDPNNGVGEFFVVTVGELEVDGYEFSATVVPTEGLLVTANLGLNDIDITEAGANEITAAVFPEETGSVYISYQLRSGLMQGLTVGGGLRHVGDRDGPVVDFDSYTIADINFKYPLTDRTEVAFDILNVNDEEYIENSASFAQNITAGSVLGPPRTAVLTFRSKF